MRPRQRGRRPFGRRVNRGRGGKLRNQTDQKQSENAQYISESMMKGELECMVCMMPIGKRGKIWNCKQCRVPFHLTCIKQWIQKTGVEWACPGCNYIYLEKPDYTCYCGKVLEPQHNPNFAPHSCGDIWGRKRAEGCPHLCPNVCHPGLCPPCTGTTLQKCFCEKTSRSVLCRMQTEQYSCGSICGRVLDCGKHTCQELCHEGDCNRCERREVTSCFCGKLTKEVRCQDTDFSCGDPCGHKYSCGIHYCEKTCHKGDCGLCPLDPIMLKTCPCGKGPQPTRVSCTDPVATCVRVCDKRLICGHFCQQKCHTGPCPPCTRQVTAVCACGGSTREMICSGGEVQFRWDRICNTKKACGKHRCQEKCCPVKPGQPDPEGRHLWFIVCGKLLSWGRHTWDDFCHIGNCKNWQFVYRPPATWFWTKTAVLGPIHCAEYNPEWGQTWEKMRDWGHPWQAKCHEGDCPIWVEIVSKPCNCGSIYKNVPWHIQNVTCGKRCPVKFECGHSCKRKWHMGPCREGPCKEICGKARATWSHNCVAICHFGEPCPDTPCTARVNVYCACKAQHKAFKCSEKPDALPCNDECERIQRNEKLEKALHTEEETPEQFSGELIEFALKNKPFILKLEAKLLEVLKRKSKVTFLPPMNQAQRGATHDLVNNHYNMETISHDYEPNRSVAVYYVPEAKTPKENLGSVIKKIEAGELKKKEKRPFQGALLFYQLQMNDRTEDVQDALKRFEGEFEVTWVNDHSAQCNFFSLSMAYEAKRCIETRPGPYSICRLIKNQTEETVDQQPAQKKRFRNSKRNPEETKEEDSEPKVEAIAQQIHVIAEEETNEEIANDPVIDLKMTEEAPTEETKTQIVEQVVDKEELNTQLVATEVTTDIPSTSPESDIDIQATPVEANEAAGNSLDPEAHELEESKDQNKSEELS